MEQQITARMVLGNDEILLPSGHLVLALNEPDGIVFQAFDGRGRQIKRLSLVEELVTWAFDATLDQFQPVIDKVNKRVYVPWSTFLGR